MDDRVAQYGFGKMFRKYWHDQLESANTMRKYMIKRGARLAMPSMLVMLFEPAFLVTCVVRLSGLKVLSLDFPGVQRPNLGLRPLPERGKSDCQVLGTRESAQPVPPQELVRLHIRRGRQH